MKKILIVDDSRTSRKILRAILEDNNYEICAEATNGEDGVKLYKEFKPDVVTLDVTMPVLDGLSCLKEIMAFDPNAKCIMVTAAGQQNNVVDAIKSGASDYVTKPFDEDVIIKAVSKLAGD